MPKQAIGIVQLLGCRCRCGHEWLPRDKDDRPRVCPKCKSPNWDRPKLFERKRRVRSGAVVQTDSAEDG
jgi:predicted Zn-ribbon and HTH transcriptional regulator